MDREEMLQYIHLKVRSCHDSTEEAQVVRELAEEFLTDPDKCVAFATCNVVNRETQKVMSMMHAITDSQQKEDPESFSEEDFPPITDFDQQVRELYDNPNVNGCTAWIQTHKGHKFFPQYPDKSVIDVEDIAHALANQCRFGGHPKHHYSVAQHSILVSYLCQPENALYGLMHDSSEAYIPDMPSPIKRLPELAGYCQLEKGIMRAILKHFDLPEQEPVDVKQADLLVLGIEAQTFMSPPHADWKAPREAPPFLTIQVKSPEEVKAAFLLRFHQLTGYKYQHDRSEK